MKKSGEIDEICQVGRETCFKIQSLLLKLGVLAHLLFLCNYDYLFNHNLQFLVVTFSYDL